MPGNVLDWSVTKFELIAVVWVDDVPYELDVVNAVLNWEMNAIPFATIRLAIGREAETLEPAVIHTLVDELTVQLPFQLYMKAEELAHDITDPDEEEEELEEFLEDESEEEEEEEGEAGEELEEEEEEEDLGDVWPEDPFLIFEGYLTDTGFSKQQNGTANFILQVQHWLTDLNFSSGLSRQSTPGGPTRLYNTAAITVGTGALATPGTNFVLDTGGSEDFTFHNVTKDFWGLSLKPWLFRICSQDLLLDADDPNLNDPNLRLNSEAVRALSRFEPFPVLNDAGEPVLDPEGDPLLAYTWGVPLLMNPVASLGREQVPASFSKHIARITSQEVFIQQTLWDILVGGYAQNFLFVVIPMVSTALIVPFQPGIQDIWQTIETREYDSIVVADRIPRALRGVRVLGGVGSETGALALQQGQAASQDRIGGAFTNPFMTDGMFLYIGAPAWLSNVIMPPAFAAQAMAPGGVVGSAIQPGAGAAPTLPDPALLWSRNQTLLNDYAEACYVNEVLKGRLCTIGGKLRFDIGVGSSVRINVSEEKFVKDELGLEGDDELYGHVTRLSHYLDAENNRASTTFDVNWVRTALENFLPGTSIASHPLYDINWFGSPNVDMEEFRPPPQPPPEPPF